MLWPLGWLLWLNILSRYLLQLFPGDIWQLALTFCILSYICNLCRKYFKEKLSKFQKNLTLNLVKKWNLSHFQTNTIKLAEGRHPTVTLLQVCVGRTCWIISNLQSVPKKAIHFLASWSKSTLNPVWINFSW